MSTGRPAHSTSSGLAMCRSPCARKRPSLSLLSKCLRWPLRTKLSSGTEGKAKLPESRLGGSGLRGGLSRTLSSHGRMACNACYGVHDHIHVYRCFLINLVSLRVSHSLVSSNSSSRLILICINIPWAPSIVTLTTI